MAALQEIEKRHAKRCEIIKGSKQLKPPMITDWDNCTDHNKIVKDSQKDLLNECFMIEVDVHVLLRALHEAARRCQTDPERLVEAAWLEQRLDDETRAILNKRRLDETEARVKEERARGEIEGQQKMFDPSKMPAAEAAGPVVTRKLESVE